jgi:hypothetical protein
MNTTTHTMTTTTITPAKADWRNPWAMLFSLADGVDTRKLRSTSSSVKADIRALLERAAQYEATQPSFAADLRAAAHTKLQSL